MSLTSNTPTATGPLAKQARKQKAKKPRLAAMFSFVLLAGVGALIVLAARTDVPQITRAPGKVVPLGDHTQIETMEGGIVAEVHVGEGERVEMGDILVELYNPSLAREHETLREQLVAVDVRAANARAVLGALNEEGGDWAERLDRLSRQGLGQAAAELQVYAESQAIRSTSIASQQKTIGVLTQATDLTTDRVARRREVFESSQQLFERGLVTRTDLRAEEDQLDTAKTRASDAIVRLAEAQNAVTTAIAERAQETLTLREETLAKLDILEQEQAQLRTALKIVSTRLDSLKLAAPRPGIVQSVAFPNPGEVIEPGETVFELLPSEPALVVEARIPGTDIGHVTAQHAVTVGIDNYDARRYGKVSGQLATFSPIPLTDEVTGAPYFRATVRIDANTVGEGAYQMPILAGMTTVSEIATGEQSLLSYLLKPMQYTLQRAFTER
ncbi:MAG: HlyD family type I secretion periplasmic adaptor subunit [Pseudomonadota bacterium]